MDINSIYDRFSDQLDQLIDSYDQGNSSLQNLVQFAHFIICRHVITRQRLGLLDYELDNDKKLLVANTIKHEDEPLAKTFIQDVKYTPFYYQAWSETEPVPMPSIKDLNGRRIGEVSKILNSSHQKIEEYVKDKDNADIVQYLDHRVQFSKDAYPELQGWINEFNDMFVEAGNLATFLMENQYGYCIDKCETMGQIILDVYKADEMIYNNLVESETIKAIPSEMKEAMSLIYMVTAAAGLHLEMGPSS